MNVDKQLALLMQGADYGDTVLENAMRDELRELLLQDRPLRVYCGYDPTSTDLHLGHTISMRKLRQFQDLGHDVTFLIGDYTALVGDPSDKNEARPLLSEKQIEDNAKTYATQAFRILDAGKTHVRYNREWLAKLPLSELIKLAQNFTVQQFLGRDNFSLRLTAKQPIYLHEMLYAVMQGYDAVAMEADVQVGGSDQLFNIIVAGRKLQQSVGQKPQVGMVLGILPGTDGKLRMSKTTGNHIPIGTTASDMYGKVMSIPDYAMKAYWRLATRAGPSELDKVECELEDGSKHPRDAKIELAAEITGVFWGQDEARAAGEYFRKVFREQGAPEEMPRVMVGESDGIVDILVKSGFSSSRSDARRMIKQGGVRIKGLRVDTETWDIPWGKEPPVLQVGRRRYALLIQSV